jgi:hypothetical protein
MFPKGDISKKDSTELRSGLILEGSCPPSRACARSGEAGGYAKKLSAECCNRVNGDLP